MDSFDDIKSNSYLRNGHPNLHTTKVCIHTCSMHINVAIVNKDTLLFGSHP